MSAEFWFAVAWLASGLLLTRWCVQGARVHDGLDLVLLGLCTLCGPMLGVSLLIENAFRKRKNP